MEAGHGVKAKIRGDCHANYSGAKDHPGMADLIEQIGSRNPGT